MRAILNKTKKDKIISTNIRLELEMDKIKNDIHKSRLIWFGHEMQREERIHMKMLLAKMKGKPSIETQNQMYIPNYKAYRNERENWEENRKWENRDLSVIFYPYVLETT